MTMHFRPWPLFSLCLFSAVSAFSQSITASWVPTAVADGGGTGTVGTPYAVHVVIQGWTSAANGQAFLKIYNLTNNEYMWTGAGWSNTTTYNPANQPVVNIDASGNWSGWIYAKHNAALGSTAAVRAAKVGSTSTNRTTSTFSLTVLDMSASGTGGWIFRDSSTAVNKPIVAYSNGSIVGSYRTEENGIAEGYGYAAGGFKIAVPAGVVDSLVSINEDGSRDQSFVGPWFVSAGQQTDASGSGAQVGKGKAIILPARLAGGLSHQLTVRLYPTATDTLRGAELLVPALWSWSQVAGDVTVVGPGAPVAEVSGDTVSISSFVLPPGDSLDVVLNGVTPYDTTASFSVFVKTGITQDSLFPVAYQPYVFIYGTPLPISDARQNDANGVPLLNNRWITVRGVATVAGELGRACYIEDNSGGMVVYDSAFAADVHLGDEVIVSGLVQPFNGLMEIVQPVVDAVVGGGNSVEPELVSASQIANDGAGGVERYEGKLVRLNGVTVTGGGSWSGGANYTIADGSGTTELRIDSYSSLVGLPIPSSSFDLLGVVGQYVTQSPYIGGYQIFPRFPADIISSGPVFLTVPVESAIAPTSMTISWETVHEGSSYIRYGRTSAGGDGLLGSDSLRLDHEVRLSGLEPATVYYVKAFSVAGSDTSFASTLIVSTASAPPATGVINVYFNHSVDTTLAWYRPALGSQDLTARLLTRLDSAHRSIDAALYSLSGTPGGLIASALANAKNRGVRIRVICEADNRNTAPFNNLANYGIPLITDAFDPVNSGAGLMHNKFFIIDALGGAADSVWVWTGSWNPTDPGTYDDYQNAIEIQDPALANAYALEFNEMWGSDSDVPNASVSRFGARKTDNTPHRFVIGGREVECYFSPSDRTTSHIVGAINGAGHSVAFDLLTLTRSDIAGALVAQKLAGVKVRGLLDDASDQGSQYAYLTANDVDVHLKSGTSGLLHHKYGLIDAEDPNWNPVLMTGSHNWTNAAENSNNENFLLIRDGDIANQYLQEFAARYYQFHGADSILVGVRTASSEIPGAFALLPNYPNPFNPVTRIVYELPVAAKVRLQVYDILGAGVATLVDAFQSPGRYEVRFDGGRFASGVYFCRLTAGRFTALRKMLLLR